ncbi:MAG: hypothetical protein Athens071412_448 [Parcubacteria group bacterium Athens0714_12]|nr:MAG: hypothetical protein Athens071412_448 [Parcubacteria group bacterium Athens0714_12]
MRQKILVIVLIIYLLFPIHLILAEMTSSNYKIEVDSLNFSGAELDAGDIYKMSSTLGEVAVGYGSSGYAIFSGYRYMVNVYSNPVEEAGAVPSVPGSGPLSPETIPPLISEIKYSSPDSETIIIEWETNEPTTSELDFGLTPEYELGRLKSRPEDLTKKHKIIIKDLKPDTKYYFRPRAKDLQGNETLSKGFIYDTPDNIAPANVSSLKARSNDKQITLRWINPFDEDFAGVKIQRSLEYFPLSVDEGETVYQGEAMSFIDKYLENNRKYYYTIFSYDGNNNFSSGAIISAAPQSRYVPPVAPPEIPPGVIPSEVVPFLPPEFAPPIPEENIEILDFSDIISFEMAKGTLKIEPDEKNKIKILPNVALNLFIAKEKLSPFLKSIIATVGESSYLLKINQEKSVYEVSFITPGNVGKYALNALVLIYKDGKIQVAKGELEVEEPGYVCRQSTAKRLPGAEVTLYHFNQEKNVWEKWPASQYFQVNPEITDNKGEYIFMVNPGEYYLTVSKEGYDFKKTEIFEAKNIINQKVGLEPIPFFSKIKSYFDWQPIIDFFGNSARVLIAIIVFIIIFLLFKLIPSWKS